MSTKKSIKSGKLALLLCLFGGCLGLHRFYIAKIGTGILMLLTFGGFGVWTLIDLVFIVSNKLEDSAGNQLIFSTVKPIFIIFPTILIWLVIIFTIFIGIIFYVANGLTSVVTEQVASLESGDVEKAYMYTSPAFKKITSLSEFNEFTNLCPSLSHQEDTYVNARRIENHYGFVNIIRVAKNGTKTSIAFQLIKNDGEWLVQNIHCKKDDHV